MNYGTPARCHRLPSRAHLEAKRGQQMTWPVFRILATLSLVTDYNYKTSLLLLPAGPGILCRSDNHFKLVVGDGKLAGHRNHKGLQIKLTA